MKISCGLLPLLIGTVLVGPALAGDKSIRLDDVTLTTGVGLMNISASEFVYHGPVQISRLDWNTRGAMAINVDLAGRLKDKWWMRANFSTAVSGDSDMEDRDWIYSNDAGPSGPDDWTHRSYSPRTSLDYLIQAGLELDRQLYRAGDLLISAGPGFKYTDVQWTATGGTYVYTSTLFRDTVGTLPSTKNITYRQSMPVGFIGLNAENTLGGLTMSGSVRGGASFAFRDFDQHFNRALEFDQTMYLAPFASASAQVSYAFNDMSHMFVSAAAERIFSTRGDRQETDTHTGSVDNYTDAAGASFQSMSLSAGVNMRF